MSKFPRARRENGDAGLSHESMPGQTIGRATRSRLIARRPKTLLGALAVTIVLCAGPAVAQLKTYGVGETPTAEQIAGWDKDVRPDGKGLPIGKGTAAQGEQLYIDQCSSCHGEFGESAGRWPILSGGDLSSLKSDNPIKSIGSYWPYASTLIDYVHAAMPFGNARSLEGDDLYSIVAYVLYLNDVIDQDFVLSNETFPSIKLPNEANFIDDDRETSEKHFWVAEPCMTNCAAKPAEILGRARNVDVTPEEGKGPKVE